MRPPPALHLQGAMSASGSGVKTLCSWGPHRQAQDNICPGCPDGPPSRALAAGRAGSVQAAQDCNPTPAGADRAHPQASGNRGSRPDLGVQCVFSGVTACPRSPTALHSPGPTQGGGGAHLSEQHHAYLRDFCKLSIGLTALLGCFHGNFIVVHKGPVHTQLAGLRGGRERQWDGCQAGAGQVVSDPQCWAPLSPAAAAGAGLQGPQLPAAPRRPPLPLPTR